MKEEEDKKQSNCSLLLQEPKRRWCKGSEGSLYVTRYVIQEHIILHSVTGRGAGCGRGQLGLQSAQRLESRFYNFNLTP